MFVDHGFGLDEMAREHASRRNTNVVTLLAYVAALKSRQAGLRPELIKEHPARWQDLKAKQSPRPEGDYELNWDPARGYSQEEAAHCLPCSLDYDNSDLSALGANVHETRLLRSPFADVSPMPAVYNDADQRAEDAGLRRTLERAVRKVVADQPTGSPVVPSLIQEIYEHIWVLGARNAYQTVIEEIRPLWATERLRSRRVEETRASGIPEHLLSIDPDAAFYQAMHDILTQYDRVTAERKPFDLQQFCLQTHVSALQTAGRRANQRTWPRKLELL